jgi:hypothetical protein
MLVYSWRCCGLRGKKESRNATQDCILCVPSVPACEGDVAATTAPGGPGPRSHSGS